jgi:dystrophin
MHGIWYCGLPFQRRLNVFDTARASGQIRVLSFKVGLLVLCRGPLTEKYIQLYNLVSTGDTMTPRQLALLLFDAIQIPATLAEVAAFGGSDIEPSVRSCFAAKGKNENEFVETLSCKQFIQWLQKEPQSMVWLPVLHRLSAAEMATHNTKCRACKAFPIVGFRYHCLKCFNFDLCHNCFFVGRTAKGHKADHPTQEYCTSTGRSANFKILGQAIRNSFRTKKYFKKKGSKLGYLPVNNLCDGNEFSPTISPNMSINSRSEADSVKIISAANNKHTTTSVTTSPWTWSTASSPNIVE